MISPGDFWTLASVAIVGLLLIIVVLALEAKDMGNLTSYTAVGPKGRAVARWYGDAWIVEFKGAIVPVEGGRDDAIVKARELSGVAYVH